MRRRGVRWEGVKATQLRMGCRYTIFRALWSSESEGQRVVTRFLLSEFGVSFATRGRGEELRKQALKRAGAASTLIVDFAGVQRVSYAFADEFVGKLVAEGDDLTVEVTNASVIVGRTVEDAVRRRTAVTMPCRSR